METTTSILEQASHWWELLHGDGVSNSDHREFGEWVARSPERVEAYLQTARLAKALKSPELRWPATSAAELIREAKASPADALLILPARLPPQRESRRERYGFRTRFALGAAA